MDLAVASPGVAGSSCSSCSSRHSLTERAPMPARIEHLHDREHALDLLDARIEFGLEAGADDIQRLAQVAVIIDRIDDRAADREIARVELRQFQLPQQVIAQRSGRSSRQTPAGGPHRRCRRRSMDSPPDRPIGRDQPSSITSTGGSSARRGGLGRGLGGRQLLVGAALGVLVLLEHDVGFEQLADVRLQLDGRQLQQPDGLLQLRRHRQLLAELELQRRLKHESCLRRCSRCLRYVIS